MSSDEPSGTASGDVPVLHRRQLLRLGAGAAVAGLAGCTGRNGPATERPTDADEPTETDVESPPESPTPTEPQPPNGPWPNAHANAANTGAVEASGPQGKPSVRWRGHVRLETGMRAAGGPDGPVATRRDGLVVAYDHDGAVRWRRRHDDRFAAAPVIAADGTIIVGSRDGRVVAYEADGTARWEQQTPEGLFAPHVNDATPFRIAGDTVVLAHPRGKVYAFALADGAERWTAETSGRTHRPAVAGGRVHLAVQRYVGHDKPRSVVRALSLADGTEQWRNEHDEPISIGPGVHDGAVYTADIQGHVVARDAVDGAERWRVRIDGDPWISTIPVVFGGRVWVGTLEAGVYGVTADGVQAHAEIHRATTPAVGNGRLYVGTSAFGGDSADAPGAVVALDADGIERWRTETRGHPDAQVHLHDGYVVFGADTGVVERLDAADGTRRWRAFARPAELPSPVVGPATVYCGSLGDDVRGYRVTDGTSHLWHAGFDGVVSGAPAVAGETVIAGSRSGEVAGTPLLEYADVPNGRLIRTPTPDPDATQTQTHIDAPAPEPRWRTTLAGPVGDVGYGRDNAYLGAGTTVASLTAAGDVRWETDVGGRVRRAPAVADDTVYAATTDGTVLALAADGGSERWRTSVGRTATAPVVARSGGTPRVVLGTDSGVVALDPADGTERWRTETGRIRGTPAIANGVAVVGGETGIVRGLAISDGTEQWRAETGGAIHGSPAIADEVAYVGSRDRHLYAVSTADGSVNWRLRLRDWVDGSPAVAYGAVFVVDQSGSLSAVVGDE